MKDSSARPGGRLWLGGKPLVGERVLSPDERESLAARLETTRRQRRVRVIALRAIDVSVAALAVGFAVWNPGDGDVALTIAAAVGVALAALMVLGSLYFAVLGRNRMARWAMRGVLVSFAVFIAFGQSLPESIALAIGAPGMLGVMWGAAGWWLEARELRVLGPALVLAAWDERAGIVQVFEGALRDEDAEGSHRDEAPMVTVEVLPHSRLVLEGKGWVIADVIEVADAPAEPDDVWPSPDLAAFQRAEAQGVYRERSLTADERAELRGLRRKHLWRGFGGLCFTMWVVAQIVDGVSRRFGAGLGIAGWALVGLIVLGLLLRHVLGWRRLGQDLARGVVLRVWDRSAQSMGDVPVGEFLPRSGWSWTEEGRPAAWRT